MLKSPCPLGDANQSIPLGSDHPSPSLSTHPSLSSNDVPFSLTQSSALFPSKLSPYPSLSVSCHCVESLGNGSLLSSVPSPSESTPAKTHPTLSTAAPRVVLGHKSTESRTPSPSVSVCVAEQPKLFTDSLEGVLGHWSWKSNTPSPSKSTSFCA